MGTTIAFYDGAVSIRMVNYYYNDPGAYDELEMPAIDLTSVADPILTFAHAYTLRDSTGGSDTLEILISTDCGAQFTSIYKKYGVDLTTTSPYYKSTAFTPNSTEWASDSIDLSNYGTNNSVIIKFRNINGHANNIYIDAINIIAGAPVTSIINVLCIGDCDGQATATGGTGQVPPFTYQWDDDSAQTTATVTGLCTGNYTVTVTDSFGVITTGYATISEPGVLSAAISTTNETCPGCNDATATALVSGGSGFYTWLWNDLLSQTTSTVAGLTAGEYIVIVTDSLCGDTLVDTVYIGVIGAVTNTIDGYFINIYPNPFTGDLFIDIDLLQPADIKIKVYNILGKVVYRSDANSFTKGKLKINLNDQPNGLYFAEIVVQDLFRNIESEAKGEFIMRKIVLIR